jgi:hypothetical protein
MTADATITRVHTNPCPECGERTMMEVSLMGYMQWKGGALIQNAFPNLTNDERELLITGTHSECWIGEPE